MIDCNKCSKNASSDNSAKQSCNEFVAFLDFMKENCNDSIRAANNFKDLELKESLKSNLKIMINYPICTEQFNNDSKKYAISNSNSTFRLDYMIFKNLVNQKVNQNFTEVYFSYAIVSERFLLDCKKSLDIVNDANDIIKLDKLRGKLYCLITFRHIDSTKNETYLIFDMAKEHKINIKKQDLDQYYDDFKKSVIADAIRKIDIVNTEITSGVKYDLAKTQDYFFLIDSYFNTCENKKVDTLRFEICYGNKNYLKQTKNAIYYATIPEEKGVILDSHFPYFDQGSLEP